MKWEARLREWICNHALLLGYAAVLALGIFLRYSYLPLLSTDLEFMNAGWFNAIKASGMAGVLEPRLQYTYSPLHLYVWTLAAKLFGSFDTHTVLKAVSFVMELGLLLAVWGLIRLMIANPIRRFIGFAALVLHPVLIWNVAGWGQTDAAYAAFSILALLLLLKEKPQWGLASLGIALAWKLQAIFLLPVFVLDWFIGKKRYSLLWFFLVPGLLALSGVPMVLIGESPLFAVNIYLGQTSMYSQITYNYPNLYALMGEAVGTKQMIHGMLSRSGMVMLIAAFGSLAVWMMHARIRLENHSTVVLISAWCVLLCVFLLPRMHERYAVVGELLLLCWALWLGKPRGFGCVAASALATMSAYAEYLLRKPFFPLQIGAFINLAVLLFLTWEVIKAVAPSSGPAQTN